MKPIVLSDNSSYFTSYHVGSTLLAPSPIASDVLGSGQNLGHIRLGVLNACRGNIRPGSKNSQVVYSIFFGKAISLNGISLH